jgi:hypothetical protein
MYFPVTEMPSYAYYLHEPRYLTLSLENGFQTSRKNFTKSISNQNNAIRHDATPG